MTHILRPPSESVFSVADALMGIPRCILVLESSIREVLSNFWDESLRIKAHGFARSMSDGCKVCGFRESSGILRSIESLLALSYDDACAIRLSLAERLLDLLRLLKTQARN
jgi:hypothetical protein